MKKDYLKPLAEVIVSGIRQQLMTGSDINVESNADVGGGGPSGGMKPNGMDFDFEEETY